MQRARFAGAEAGIGIVVFTLFYVMGVLGVVGVGVLLATGQVHASAGDWVLYAVFAAGVSWWGAMIVRELSYVRVVEVADDGTWILKGPLGIKRSSIAPGEPRRVHDREAERWILTGVPKKFTMSWAEIEAGSRRWKTCGGTPKSQRAAIALLQDWVVRH
jgi:hypothetical protein